MREFAKRIGKSTNTLRRWDKEGTLVAKRMPSGHRYYDESDLRKLIGLPEPARKTIVYCRVSSAGQRNDLASQVAAMEQYCLAHGIAVDEWIKEIGSGMNFKRKKFLALMAAVRTGDVNHLLLAHKDRLVRFGFEYFADMAAQCSCTITVVNQESLSPEQEMVQDLMTIVQVFSSRLYGLRSYKKTLKKALQEDVCNTDIQK